MLTRVRLACVRSAVRAWFTGIAVDVFTWTRPPATATSLRHTAATRLVQAGIDLPTVQRISGHKTLAMLARYAHQSGAHIQTAMMKLPARLDFFASPQAEKIG